MASFLYACINGCGGVQRFMRPHPDPVTCPSCVKAIKDNKASEKKSAVKKRKRIRASK